MKRAGFLLFVPIILILLSSTTNLEAQTLNDPKWAPQLTLPKDSTVVLCQGDSICFHIAGSDPDLNDTLTLSLLSGPISFAPHAFPRQFDTSVCFVPPNSGAYRFIWQLKDRQAHVVKDTVVFTVYQIYPPGILDQYFSVEMCAGETARSLALQVNNPSGGPLTFTKLQGPGTIDAATGTITYEPGTSGIYSFDIQVTNQCGADIARITDTVYFNLPPGLALRDTTIYLCRADDVCFDVVATDPEGTPVTIEQLEGPGQFTTVTGNSGRTCFMPGAAHTATYQFVYCVKDMCPSGSGRSMSGQVTPICFRDTISVTIVINRPPQIVCPASLEYFTCRPETFCFNVDANDPDFDAVTFNVLSGNATVDGRKVCFVGNQSDRFDIIVEAVDICGNADTCTVPVTINGNRPPYVTIAKDFTIAPCGPEAICFAATADDLDRNLQSVSVNYGRFDDVTDRVCIDVDTSGVYRITLTAVDSCGASDDTTILVTVNMNRTPVVTLGEDQSLFLCGPREVCVDAAVADDNIDRVIPSLGTYNPQTSQVCFTPQEVGRYVLSVEVIDKCGLSATDSMVINVAFSEPPFVNLGSGFSRFFCAPEPICVNVATIPVYESLIPSIGVYDPIKHQVCFTPDSSGTYTLTVEVTDSCGLSATGAVSVGVVINAPPVITPMPDTSVYLCAPVNICLPVAVSDANNNLKVVTVNRGKLENGSVCFVPYGAGDYKVIVTATDSCGAIAADTAIVHVTTDQNVHIQCPRDTSVFTCAADTFCLPISGIPANAHVTVRGVNTWYDAAKGTICFYSECSNSNHISVDVTTPCSTYTCSFVVNVRCNSAPTVILPPDTSFFACGPTAFCIPAGISDIDRNLRSVTVFPGSYNATTGRICFTADTAGVYTLTVTAMDSCGATRSNSVRATVGFNSVPVCSVPGDTMITLCGPTEVSLPVSATDADGNFDKCLVVAGPGAVTGGRWVYRPSGSQTATVTIRCQDKCGAYCEKSFTVSFVINRPPVASCPGDTTIFLCELTSDTWLCVPGFSAGDPDGNYQRSYVLGQRVLTDDSVCFAPVAGENIIEYVAVDSCGLADTCAATVNVVVNGAPVCGVPNDTTIVQCLPEKICLPIKSTDVNGNFKQCVVLSGPGEIFVYNPGLKSPTQPLNAAENFPTWCYTPTKDTSFSVTVRCLDSCGAYCDGTFGVTIKMNRPPEVVCHADTSLLLCGPGETSLSGFSAGDPDGNLSAVNVTGGTWQGDGRVTFVPVAGKNTILVTAIDDCGAKVSCVTSVNVSFNREPVCLTPNDTTLYLCEPTLVTLPVRSMDPDGNGEGCRITSGPGELLDGYWRYQASKSEVAAVTVSCSDSCGAVCTKTFTVTIHMNTPPVVEKRNYSAFYCAPGQIRNLEIGAVDADGDRLIYTLLSAFGSIDPSTGILSYVVDTNGVYRFDIRAADTCSAVEAVIYDTISVNLPPHVVAYDSTVRLCAAQQVCFTVVAKDPDGRIVSIRQTSGPGQFTMLTDTSGQTCFMPENSDSATYMFTYCASDGCDANHDGQPDCSEGMIMITVVINRPPQITCPPELAFLSCSNDTFCFDVATNDPDGDQVTLNVLSQNAAVKDSRICINGGMTGQFNVVIEAVDVCGHADTCAVPVNITPNLPPVVTVDPDFAAALCEPAQVCFRYAVSDPNGNVARVWTSYGELGQQPGTVCFLADTSGIYSIQVNAADSCGEIAGATIHVTVDMNASPVVNLGADRTVALCAASEICVDAIISDRNLKDVTVTNGHYNAQTHQVCFTPQASGDYTIGLEAVDSCGARTTDEVKITVRLAEKPFVNLGQDQSKFLCEKGQICVPVSTIERYVSLTTNLGQYDPAARQVCFAADTSGVYRLVVAVVDTCGLGASDTANIKVTLNSPPVLSHMPDTTVYICKPQYIVLPLNVSDPDGNIRTITVNRGKYANGQVSFVPYGAGDYTIIATVTDSCGVQRADTAVVTVKTDQAVSLVCPRDTTIFVCSLDTICLPVQGIPDYGQVTVRGINTWWDKVNQTVCFYTECAVTNHITVTVTTPCGTYSCSFSVKVVCNTPPLVILPPDTIITICAATDICLPVGISDPDHNLKNVTVDGGTYYPSTGRVCFTAQSAGTRVITVRAEDLCGAIGEDRITVQVRDNAAPQVMFAVTDTTVTQCVPQAVCLPVNITDTDGNIVQITSSRGVYDAQKKQVCFTPPDTNGTYCVTVIARDACGLADTAQACVVVKPASYVRFDCPQGIINGDTLCAAGSACVPLTIVGERLTVTSTLGTYVNGRLCFQADTSGVYSMQVTVVAECNQVSCSVRVKVTIPEPVAITCPGNAAPFLCGPDTLIYDFAASSSVKTVSVTPPAFITDRQVNVPVLQSGSQLLTMIASGTCGADTCSFTVAAGLNSAPQVTAGNDTVLNVCALTEICLKFGASDVDNNIDSVRTSLGTINGDRVCFTPPSFGVYNVTITAWDACRKSASKTVKVTVNRGADATIFCPQDQYVTLCSPETVWVAAPITPANAVVTVTPNGRYDKVTGRVGVWVQQSATIKVTITAQAQCNPATCTFNLHADVGLPPVVTCPSRIDTLLCLAQPVNLCFPVTVTGTGLSVTVKPVGTYSANVVCVPITTAGTQTISIIAAGVCGFDTCTTTINVSADQPPALVLPATQTFERCDYDTTSICIGGIFAGDAESNVTLSMICGSGQFQLAPGATDSGHVCFRPDHFGSYDFCFEAFDGCRTTTDTFSVNIVEKPDCDVCVRLSIDGGGCVPVGMAHNVALNIETNQAIGGFDLLVSFDASVLSFQSVTIAGSAIYGWEYFIHRLNSGACGSSCPSGLVRFIGIADVNNGNNHPPLETLTPRGLFMTVQFLIVNDQNLSGQFIPIRFVWYACGDNSFSDPTGNHLYVDNRIYNAEHILIWDEQDDVLYPENLREFGLGAADSCVVGSGKAAPERCIEFINGGICVISADSIDYRGDVNLNNIAYEIADVVVFTNYFIYGLSAFTINVAGQIAATDVNADGLTLSVADLVYLIRVVVGDAEPMPKVTPYADDLVLTTDYGEGAVKITSDAVGGIGGALLVYRLDDSASLGTPVLADDAANMSMAYIARDGELRILIYSIGRDRVQAGKNTLLEIPCAGKGRPTLIKAEVVDYQGQPYRTVQKEIELPSDYVLNQNYPNPFNPSTSISFSLPTACRWTLKIFNITGALVTEFSNHDQAGSVTVVWDGRSATGVQAASGVYFYRLETEAFSDTKKMVLLK